MALSLNQMTLELGNLAPLSNEEYARFKKLFKTLLHYSKSADLEQRVKGNVTVSLDGNGGLGQIKVERFVNLEK